MSINSTGTTSSCHGYSVRDVLAVSVHSGFNVLFTKSQMESDR